VTATVEGMTDLAIDLVVFDLGGVLVRIVRSWAEAHAAAGLPPHAILDSAAFHERRAELAREHQVGAMEPAAYFAAVAEASGGAYTVDVVRRVLEAWQSVEQPGVSAVLDAIEAAGARTGALSNTNSVHWAALRPTSGVPRFPTVARLQHACASHLLRLAKPDPAIFAAFERCQGVEGARVLFFDDLEANVEAARRHGWEAHLVDPEGDTAALMLEVLGRYGIAPAEARPSVSA
jgi:putative hydrolase of the HAD superfamily